jgi:hypothetical protein
MTQQQASFGKAVLCSVALASLLGCATAKVVETQKPIAAQAPEWVNKGSGAFKDATGGDLFYGVGMASGIRNRALAVTAADDRARAEIAKVMNTYVATLTKSYMASTTAGDMNKSSEEQHVQSTMKTFAQFTLHGAMPVDHWVDRSDKANPIYYSLVKLDMAAVQQSLNDSKELDAKVKDYVKANAEKAFDELAAEEAKR